MTIRINLIADFFIGEYYDNDPTQPFYQKPA